MSLLANITPEVLVWARETAGFSIERVAKRIDQAKVTVEKIKDWENGKARPSYTQFEKLAGIYKRPLALFFLPEPPQEEDINQKFRSLPDSYIKELSPQIRFIVRSAVVRQLDLAELHQRTALPDLEQLSGLKRNAPHTKSGAKKLAHEVRKLLGVSLMEQKKWKDTDSAFKNWRTKLEGLGLWIFKESFGKELEAYDGFFLPDDSFPVIYINNDKPESRRIFTLFHELGHFLLSKGGICFRDNLEQGLTGRFRQEEVFCNAFAGELLVPDADLILKQMPSDEEIRKYAKTYKVSSEVILRKCKDRGLIDWDEYNRRISEWAKDFSDDKNGGGNYYSNQKAYLGEKYLSLVFSRYYQHHISISQLTDYLGIKEKSLPKLEAVMYQTSSE